MKIRTWLNVIFLILCSFIISACGHDDKNTLKVGTISGPETELMHIAKQIAKSKYGLNVKIIEFTDYNQPNAALNEGSINANMFQHKAYLDQQNTDHHYTLSAVAKTFIYPMGIYSSTIKSISDLPAKSIVAIPNDPSNEGRALLLLQKAGLIRLKKSAGLYATPSDIQSNPKELIFKELDAAQLARSLQDVSIAVINTNYAIPAGLSPKKDALLTENKDSPYVNLIVVRSDEKNDPRITQFVQAFQSNEVKKAANDIFNGEAIAAW